MTKPTLFKQDERKDLLRLVTAGSVDDGKSTMIGRLLYESKGIYEDQLASVRRASARKGDQRGDLDLALVTDGLRAEVEQGITIDVAYRYFSTPRRKFIIADTPGHEQYTRNMATGASTAGLVIVLIDARNGVVTQSRRHAFIATLLGIPHMVVAVNKMDLVGYSQEVFDDIVRDFQEFAAKLELSSISIIPISALEGDNVVERGTNLPWYGGHTLLSYLETVHTASDRNLIDLRFPIQYVSRPGSSFRGYMGTPTAGIIRSGAKVMAIPSGMRSRIRKVYGVDGEITEGFPPLPITVTLEDEIDLSRGDMLVHPQNVPQVQRSFEAMVVWMSEDRLVPHRPYVLKHTTRKVQGTIAAVRYAIDVDTLHRKPSESLGLNEIGRCLVDVARPLAFDPYRSDRSTGAFIVIDRVTNNTVGAGMILGREQNPLQVDPARRIERARVATVTPHESRVAIEERIARLSQKPATVWITGLTGSGKTTLAHGLERRLFDDGVLCQVVDGENLRLGVCKDLSFSPDDRAENNRRAAEVARLFNLAGLISICAFLSPYREDRARVRQIVGEDRFLEIYLSATPEACRRRARKDVEIETSPPVIVPYEAPLTPDLKLPTHEIDIDESVDRIVVLLRNRGFIS